MMVRILVATSLLWVACGDDDGGMPDGAMPDAQVDAGAVCSTDEDCDDGLFCNGTETCDGARCLLGTAPDCDDGIECTRDECDEARDECASRAPDEDGDGVGTSACVDAEGTPLGNDCDDTDARRFPGNVEVCDTGGLDEDCDPTTFGRVDLDLDGVFDAACCNGDTCGTDCNDLRPDVRPGSVEACDRIDNDCDGSFDEGVAVAGFADADRDGYGDSSMPMTACPGTVGFVPAAFGDDCDDADPARNPGQVEICDEVDNDCNMLVDDDPSIVPWYADLDGDGFGDPNDAVDSCEPIAGRVLLGSDCDDSNAARHPASPEACNGIDDDCNGLKDFEVAPGDFEDDDDDGMVDLSCGAPFGVDCDDRNPATGAGSREICDGRDNDCDGDVDEGAMDAQFFFDGDGDGFGTNTNPDRPVLRACMPAPGYVAAGGDCDDMDPGRAPGAPETCNGIDDDCDSAVDEGGVAVCGCPIGTADCDMDGRCETDLDNDVANCGACDSSCAAATGVSSALCVSRTCVITRCADGLDDCDGNPANGCETDLTTLTDCRDCGNRCEAPPGTGVVAMACTSFGCRVTSCEAGRADCNGDPFDGCETDTTDPNHCGGCNVRCEDGFGGVGDCVAGACQFPCGIPDRADCDGEVPVANGCEAFLGDRNTCGDCSTVCPSGTNCEPNPTGPGFACRVRCADNTADCDGVAANGCEVTTSPTSCGCGGSPQDCVATFGASAIVACVGRDPGVAECELRGCSGGTIECAGQCSDLSSDPNHCGSCFTNCGGGTCVGGACDCSTIPGTTFCSGFGCVDTQFDTENCGGCGIRCTGSEMCQSGSCVVPCPPGQQDCGAGCIDTERDPANCGGCGIMCPSPSTTLRVRSSRCEFASCRIECEPGFEDCNADPSDGCEVNLDSDPANCNACGNSCGVGGTCALGSCDGIVGAMSGGSHSCAVRGAGTLLCWGDDNFGQVGDDAVLEAFVASPAPVVGLPSPTDVIDVVGGAAHTCALLVGASGNEVWCWGDDTVGQLGCGGTCGPAPGMAQLPAAVQPLELTAGDDFTCALVLDTMTSERHVYCWGVNNDGQLGIDSVASTVNVPMVVVDAPASSMPLQAQSVSAGGRHACAVPTTLSIGPVSLRCWGADDVGQLGNNAGGPSRAPVATDPFGTLLDPTHPIVVGAGGLHTCAALEGDLFCWGSDMWSETGVGNAVSPTEAFPPGYVDDLVAYRNRTCVFVNGSQLRCRGDNTQEELQPGDPSTTITNWQLINGVGGDVRFLSRGSSAAHQCVLNANRELFCWGDDERAQIGLGATALSRPVTRVPF